MQNVALNSKLIDLLNVKLSDSKFISTYKTRARDFTRKRNFTFKSLSLFILSNIQGSIQRELDRFFKDYNNQQYQEQFATQSAFSQARKKIKFETFIHLNNDSINYFYSNYDYKRWHGHRLIGIDGTEVFLPKNDETIKEFDTYTTNLMNKEVVLARGSKAYDVLNKITIDAQLVNKSIGERRLAKEHIKMCSAEDLFLLDRGYPSYDLFKTIKKMSGEFCARVPKNSWNAVKELLESEDKELICKIYPNKEKIKEYKAKGISYKPIICRFVKVELASGEIEVLITSLLDEEEYPYEVFKKLYFMRWDIEESYKKDKHRLQLENFSGKSVIAIMQEFHAKILFSNLTSILSSDLERDIEKITKKRKYSYQLNFTTALSKVKDFIATLFTTQNKRDLFDALKAMFLSNIQPIRANRSNIRNKSRQRRRYFRTYTQL